MTPVVDLAPDIGAMPHLRRVLRHGRTQVETHLQVAVLRPERQKQFRQIDAGRLQTALEFLRSVVTRDFIDIETREFEQPDEREVRWPQLTGVAPRLQPLQIFHSPPTDSTRRNT